MIIERKCETETENEALYRELIFVIEALNNIIRGTRNLRERKIKGRRFSMRAEAEIIVESSTSIKTDRETFRTNLIARKKFI